MARDTRSRKGVFDRVAFPLAGSALTTCPVDTGPVGSSVVAKPDSTYGMIYGMRRTTVYLPDDLKAALERTAAAHGTTEAEVVRSALTAATIEHAHPKPRIPLFASGDATLAERVDEALAAGFGVDPA